MLGDGYLVNRVLLEVQNKVLFEDFLDRFIQLIMTIASDDIENFKDLTTSDKGSFSLRPLIKYFTGNPSIFRKQIGEHLTREFTDKVTQNEVPTYEALREVFGSHLTHQIFVSKVINIEYQSGLVAKNIRSIFE
jgi:hypothetical protein